MSGNQIGGKRARDINLANDPQFYRKSVVSAGKPKSLKGLLFLVRPVKLELKVEV